MNKNSSKIVFYQHYISSVWPLTPRSNITLKYQTKIDENKKINVQFFQLWWHNLINDSMTFQDSILNFFHKQKHSKNIVIFDNIYSKLFENTVSHSLIACYIFIQLDK